MSYSSFRDFVDATRRGTVKFAALSASDRSLHFNSIPEHLPKEGVVPAIFSGHHIYVKLDLRPGLTTSSNNEDRMKSISLLADLTQGVRSIVHEFDGALLEAQGPVVHAFIPDETGSNEAPRIASVAIIEFVNQRIKPRAGDGFLKSLVAYCYGPSVFVGSVDQHGDNSIVSLAPAANTPAKLLWGKSDTFRTGTIIEVQVDGRYRVLTENDLLLLLPNERRSVVVNASLALPELLKEARELSVPPPSSPDSPTVESPHESFSVSIRADMDGFTARVKKAFESGNDAVLALANEFHAIMVHARQFGIEVNAIHLPWAGDCFNLLLAVDERAEYLENKKRRILEILTEFQKYMAKEFPEINWSYSCAGGDLENAQKCNTLVSRVTVGHTTLLLATGLPVERSLSGLAQEGPVGGHGVIWKSDVTELDEDLKNVIKPCFGGENYRHFTLADIESVRIKSFFIPPKPAYDTGTVSKSVVSAAPLVRPYCDEE